MLGQALVISGLGWASDLPAECLVPACVLEIVLQSAGLALR